MIVKRIHPLRLHLACHFGILSGVPTGTRPDPGLLSVAVAAHLRAAMARQTPPMTQLELARLTGIDASTLSRLLTPKKQMLVEQLDAICRALRIDTAAVIDSARKVVAEYEAEKLRGEVSVTPRAASGE